MLSLSLLLAMTAATAAPTTTLDPAARLPISRVAQAAAALSREPDAIARALAAQAMGDYDAARREYIVAIALDRDAGRLPTQASYGLALILNEQGQHAKAAKVMEQLAADAAHRQEDEIEARALIDARFLNGRARRVAEVRDNSLRLAELARSRKVSTATRRQILTA